jgi:predicted aspartyl protease
MRFTAFIFLTFSLIGNSAFGQNPYGFDLNDGLSSVELTFKNESNLMIIPIKINGAGPYNFILDSGSESGMIFDKLIIGKNNLVNARVIPVYAKNGTKITDIYVANNIDVDLRGVSGADQSMYVLQENFVNIENVLGVEAHGILGSEIFNRFVVEIDYIKMKVRLTKPSAFKLPRGYKKFEISIENSRPFMNVKVKQKGEESIDIKLLIDTGASGALLLDADNSEEIKIPQKTVDHVIGRSIGGVLNGKVGRVKRVKIGKFKFRKVLSSYPEEWRVSEKSEIDSEGNLRYGTIGADLFSRFDVIFNYGENTLYLKKNEAYNMPFRYNTIGMNVMAYGDKLNVYFINDLIKGSPAEKAGLQVDDEVIALNGSPAFFYDLTEVNSILKRNKGERLRLIIRRDGNLIQFVLKHQRLL